MHLEPCDPPLVDPFFVERLLSFQLRQSPSHLPDESPDNPSPDLALKPKISISVPGEDLTSLSFSSPLVKHLTCTEVLTPPPSWQNIPTTTTPKSSRHPPFDKQPRQIIAPLKPEPIRIQRPIKIPTKPQPPRNSNVPSAPTPFSSPTTSHFQPPLPDQTRSLQQSSSTKRPRPPSLERTPDGRIILTREVIEESRERLRAKRPRLRHEIGGENVHVLENWYEKYSYLSKEGRKVLSEKTGLPVKTVMYWFQNKRRMMKQKMGIDHSTSMARLMKC